MPEDRPRIVTSRQGKLRSSPIDWLYACGLLQTAANNPGLDFDRIKRAYEIAVPSHQGQIRRTGENYIVHPLNVACRVAEWNGPAIMICAGLLHDTAVSVLARIENEVGSDVAELVRTVMKLSGPGVAERTFLEMRATELEEARLALTLKLADRLDNSRNWSILPRAEAKAKAQRTLTLWVPIADRLGLVAVVTELTKVASKTLDTVTNDQ